MMEMVIATPLGNLYIKETNEYITNVAFTALALSRQSVSPLLHEAASQLSLYFDGMLKTFQLPLEPEGSSFQQKVWRQLLAIPYGSTISYQTLARQLGDEKVIRAAASANGKNPIAIIIPCHRVIGARGEMTGYAAGIGRKKQLLALENAPVMQQTTLF